MSAFSRRHILAATSAAAIVCMGGAAWAPAHAQAKKEPIIIGQTSALTGVLSAANIDALRGINAHFKEINAAGGVYGRPIKLISLDDGYDVERAKANFKQLVEKDGAFALLGVGGTPGNIALNPLITEAKIPSIAPITGADNLRNPVNPYVFNIRASYGGEAARLVDQLATVGQKKVAVIHSDNAFGKGMLAATTQLGQAKGLEIVPVLVGDGPGEVDKATKTIIDSSPQAFVSLYASLSQNGIDLVKAMRTKAPGMPGYTLSLLASPSIITQLGAGATNLTVSQVVPFPYTAKSELVRKYQAAMRKSNETKFSHSSLEGYIGASVLTHGLKNTGSPISRERFITALEAKRIDLGGFEVNYTNNSRNGSRYTDLVIVGSNGQFLR